MFSAGKKALKKTEKKTTEPNSTQTTEWSERESQIGKKTNASTVKVCASANECARRSVCVRTRERAKLRKRHPFSYLVDTHTRTQNIPYG